MIWFEAVGGASEGGGIKGIGRFWIGRREIEDRISRMEVGMKEGAAAAAAVVDGEVVVVVVVVVGESCEVKYDVGTVPAGRMEKR